MTKTKTTLLRQGAFLRRRNPTLILVRKRRDRCFLQGIIEVNQTGTSANRSASLLISRLRRAGAYRPQGGQRVRGEP
ncbi:hypothetical protein [Azonexus sp. R2A61]|uniref:hypothetical protein n=1 Tax=Azonexus sp. R2A61 TaxID=2744443 RepID=UPI001F392980|nr:hypothetical protein [Azonexus sp. R2A61]